MNEKQAKRQLAKMLQTFTTGSILHLLAELHAEQAKHQDDPLLHDQLRTIERTLIVVGCGVDSAQPHS